MQMLYIFGVMHQSHLQRENKILCKVVELTKPLEALMELFFKRFRKPNYKAAKINLDLKMPY